MIGAKKLRVALGLVFVTTLGPAAVSHALPSTGMTRPVIRVEYADNGASFTWNENGMNGGASSIQPKPDDPLGFYVSAFPPAPGTNRALVGVTLVNNTSGVVHFPGGVNVPVTLRSGQRVHVALVRHAATSLAPGARLEAQTTVPLRGYGQYSASAFTVARFTAP